VLIGRAKNEEYAQEPGNPNGKKLISNKDQIPDLDALLQAGRLLIAQRRISYQRNETLTRQGYPPGVWYLYEVAGA
jgi:hypothetical protein